MRHLVEMQLFLLGMVVFAIGCNNIVVGMDLTSGDSDPDDPGGNTDSAGKDSSEGGTDEDGECDVSELLAFPCAEGYGKYVSGGRGGEVYEVVNLEPTGEGSLGEALSESGRTIVFRISGTIAGSFNIPDNTTVAGQTAPGDGITIYGSVGIGSNVIIRYIRIRYDGSGDDDAIGTRYQNDIILDHITSSWGTDEVMSIYHNENVTVQWSMVTEACPLSGDESHRAGGIWGGENNTYHHNLFAHNATDNPRWASGCGHNDYRYNVVYNWGGNSCHGGENDQGDGVHIGTWINMVANYYKPGPGTDSGVIERIAGPSSRAVGDEGNWWVAENYMNGSESVTTDNWNGVDGSSYIEMDGPWDSMDINRHSAKEAYAAVLSDVGCTRPARDSIDERIIREVRDGTATVGTNGLVTCQADTFLPTLSSAEPQTDSDHDGMPDAWETANGLDPNDASDRNQKWGPGYTMLEKYLNSLDSF